MISALWTAASFWVRLAIIGALVALLAAAAWKVHDSIWQAGWDKRDAQAKAEMDRAVAEVAEISDDLQADANNLRESKDAQIRNINGRLVAALGELRNRPARRPGNLPTAAGTCEGGTGAGLSGPDAQFLEGLAARAAVVVAERDACIAQYESVRRAQPQAAGAVK